MRERSIYGKNGLRSIFGVMVLLTVVLSLFAGEATAGGFRDSKGHWGEGAISEMVREGIVSGYMDGTFRPDENITVEEFAKLVVASVSTPAERAQLDAESKSAEYWFYPYEKKGIVMGFFEDVSFRDRNYKKNITRFQMSYILSNATKNDLGKRDVSLDAVYRDSGMFAGYREAVADVYRKGLMQGSTDQAFGGHRRATRAEAATIANRIINTERRLSGKPETLRKVPFRAVDVPVLMYHHFTDRPSNSSMISTATAKRHIEHILSKGYEFIGLNDLADYLEGKDVYMPEKPIILTVDDGYLSVYEELYPLAREFNIKISLAPIGINVGKSARGDLPYFNWEQMREMKASGLVEYQNHTYDLHYPKEMVSIEGKRVGFGVMSLANEGVSAYARRLVADWNRLENAYQKELGVRGNFIVYPYGRYTAGTESAAKGMFKGSLSVQAGTRKYRTANDLWAIPRWNMTEATAIGGIVK